MWRRTLAAHACASSIPAWAPAEASSRRLQVLRRYSTAPDPALRRASPHPPPPPRAARSTSASRSRQQQPDGLSSEGHGPDGGLLETHPPPLRPPPPAGAGAGAGADALSASDVAVQSAISSGRSQPPSLALDADAVSAKPDHKLAPLNEAKRLQGQIELAQKQLEELQAYMTQSSEMQQQQQSPRAHKPRLSDKCDRMGTSDVPDDQRRFESYANQRLQKAIDTVRARTGSTGTFTPDPSILPAEDEFISPSELGYSSNSPLQRPIFYDVYRERAAMLNKPRLMTRAAAIAAKQLQADVDAKASHWPGQRWERKGTVVPERVRLQSIPPLKQADPPRLAHGLDRVLFNPGVSWLKDPRSQIYNYDPRIRKILDFDLFDPDTAPEYITASRDPQLKELTVRRKAKFFGSTSTMTRLLSHIYFVLMGWKAPDFSTFSSSYKSLQSLGGFSMGARLPASVKLVYDPDSDTYGIDNNKNGDSPENYVLSSLGKSMETMLVSTPEEFEKHSRLHSWRLTEEDRKSMEAYHFTQAGNLMMRSQLDCQDPHLPRRTFDLKTRAVVAVRKDRANWLEGSGYQIRHLKGLLESYERETFDMVRATMLKYLLQVRIGGMDGIFVCYHNTATVFGFEYLPREQMAKILAGSDELFEKIFRVMTSVLENILTAATEHFPRQSLTLTFEARADKLVGIVTQVEDETLKRRMQGVHYGKDYNKAGGPRTWVNRSNVLFEIFFDRWLDGKLLKGPLVPPPDYKSLEVDYGIFARTDFSETAVKHLLRATNHASELMSAMYLPNVDAINERERYIETVLAQNPEALERYIRERHEGLAGRFPKPPKYKPSPSSKEAKAIFQRVTQGKAQPPARVSWIETPSKEIKTLRQLSMNGAAQARKQAQTDPLLRYEALQESSYLPSRDGQDEPNKR